MKTNLIAFFADLFNVLEIHPAKCVSFNQGRNDLADGNIIFSFYLSKLLFCGREIRIPSFNNCYAYEWLKYEYNNSDNLLIIITHTFSFKTPTAFHNLFLFF